MISLLSVWTNICWINSQVVGDLRWLRAHVISLLLYKSLGMNWWHHYSDIMIGAMASQITSLTIVYSTIYSGPDQRKYQSSMTLALVRGIHQWPVNSPRKGPVTRKMFPFDDYHHDYPDLQILLVIGKCSCAIVLIIIWEGIYIGLIDVTMVRQ